MCVYTHGHTWIISPSHSHTIKLMSAAWSRDWLNLIIMTRSPYGKATGRQETGKGQRCHILT